NVFVKIMPPQKHKKTPRSAARRKKIPRLTRGISFLTYFPLIYADLLFVSALALVLDNAVFEGEARIVSADADVIAGMDLRTSVAEEYAACEHGLPVLTLYAQALRLAVAAVMRGTRSLFMRE